MRSTTLLPLLALGLAVAGCGGTQNRGLESVHQPVVSRTDYVYDVAADYGGMNAENARRLAGWFEALKVGYGDRIAVDVPPGSGDRSAREAVATVAARYGLLISDSAPLTEGEIAPGTIRVVVMRAKAEVPGCPDWSRTSQPEFNAHTMSNYGCSTNSNLAAMIANPEDLIQGRAIVGSADTQTAGKAIKTYRTAPSTGSSGLKNETTRGGK